MALNKFLFILLTFVLYLNVKGQDSLQKSSRLLALDYGSNKTYEGRRDSVKQSYFSPYYNYSNKKGFYFFSSAYFISKHIDEIDLGFGRDFLWGKNKRTKSSISYTRYLFSAESRQLITSTPNNIQFYCKRKFKWVTSKITFNRNFGHGVRDVGLSWSNYHSFYVDLSSKSDLSFTPKVRIDSGTQNYYRKFLLNHFATVANRSDVKKFRRFTIINYEFSLPVTYTFNGLSIDAIPCYSIPTNQPDETSSTPYFFFIISASIEF
jgi:hypothetical protein